jgi:hypothetical protein
LSIHATCIINISNKLHSIPVLNYLLHACIAALALAGTIARAQPIYKSTMPDGKVIYGQKPSPGAQRVDEIAPPPAQTGTATVTVQEKQRVEQQTKVRTQSAGAQNELEDARRQLELAESGREAGREPLPGERIGIAGGGSRLTDAYHQRQKGLDAALAAARKRVADLRSSR